MTASSVMDRDLICVFPCCCFDEAGRIASMQCNVDKSSIHQRPLTTIFSYEEKRWCTNSRSPRGNSTSFFNSDGVRPDKFSLVVICDAE